MKQRAQPGEPARPHHVVVTPAHDEAGHLPELIRSMVAQTVRPTAWIIVDDASTDDTARIIDEAARAHPWIRRRSSGLPVGRSLGSRVAQVFLEATGDLDPDWALLSKVDADLTLPPDYFERILAALDADPRLGIAGGGCWEQRGGRLVLERVPRDHTRGALKTYRRACWDAMGGVRPVHGWDGIDGLLAQMHGFATRSFPEIQVIHHRPTGSAAGVLRGRFRAGRFAHFMGYHPLFMAARCVRRLADPPVAVGAVALGAGFAWARLAGDPVFDEPAAVAFLRRKQLRRLGLGRLADRASPHSPSDTPAC